MEEFIAKQCAQVKENPKLPFAEYTKCITFHVGGYDEDWQAARDAQRSPSLTQPPPRCSRSALLTLLIALAEPDPEGLPGAGRLQLGSETAARTCQRAACGLPAAAALRAAGALSASPVCSGPAAAAASLFGP